MKKLPGRYYAELKKMGYEVVGFGIAFHGKRAFVTYSKFLKSASQ